MVGLGEVLFVHGSPRSDTDPIQRGTADHEIRLMIADVSQSTIVCGHTHIQFDRFVDGTRIVNASSVGLQSVSKVRPEVPVGRCLSPTPC